MVSCRCLLCGTGSRPPPPLLLSPMPSLRGEAPPAPHPTAPAPFPVDPSPHARHTGPRCGYLPPAAASARRAAAPLASPTYHSVLQRLRGAAPLNAAAHSSASSRGLFENRYCSAVAPAGACRPILPQNQLEYMPVAALLVCAARKGAGGDPHCTRADTQTVLRDRVGVPLLPPPPQCDSQAMVHMHKEGSAMPERGRRRVRNRGRGDLRAFVLRGRGGGAPLCPSPRPPVTHCVRGRSGRTPPSLPARRGSVLAERICELLTSRPGAFWVISLLDNGLPAHPGRGRHQVPHHLPQHNL